jgi:hypothetical protein
VTAQQHVADFLQQQQQQQQQHGCL